MKQCQTVPETEKDIPSITSLLPRKRQGQDCLFPRVVTKHACYITRSSGPSFVVFVVGGFVFVLFCSGFGLVWFVVVVVVVFGMVGGERGGGGGGGGGHPKPYVSTGG